MKLTITEKADAVKPIKPQLDDQPSLTPLETELLDALRQMVSAMWQHFEFHHDGDDDFDNDYCQMAIEQARAAIQKARGIK